MQRISSDSYTALILFAIACIALWNTRDLNNMSATFPRTVGFILLGLSAVYFVTSILRPNKAKLFAEVDKRRVVSMVLGMVVYVGLMWIAGFLPASVAFIAFFVWFLQGRGKSQTSKLIRAGMFSILVGSSFYLLFRFVFLVPLPNGVLFGG